MCEAVPGFAHDPVRRALEQAERTVREKPVDPYARLRRSAYRRLTGDWAGALADLDVALQLSPGLAEVDLYRGRVFLDSDRLPEAVEAFSRLLSPVAAERTSELRPLAYSLRARAFVRLGELRAAHDDIDSAIRIATRPGPELYAARARLVLAGALDGMHPDQFEPRAHERARAAMRGLQQGLASLGQAAGLDAALLDLELELGWTASALARLDRLLAGAPRKDGLLERRGEALRRAGLNAAAAQAFARARAELERLPAPRRGAPVTVERARRLDGALVVLDTFEARGTSIARAVVTTRPPSPRHTPSPFKPHSRAATTLIRGPYLQRGSPTSAILRWRTDLASDTWLAHGPSPGQLTTMLSDGTLTTEHEMAIGGLSPATQYFYAVGSTTQQLAGDDAFHFFWTSPTTGTAVPTRVWVVGDSGSANAGVAAVRDAFLAFTGVRPADVWLMLGDNAYTSGTDPQYQAAVFDVFRALLRNTFVWPAIGNHDALSADSPTQSGPYFDSFTLPTLGEAGGAPSGTEAYYSFDYGNVHFVCLDSADSNLAVDGTMMLWLVADLETTLQPWIVVYFHHPPYSKGSHNSDDPVDSAGRLFAMREVFLPVLESYGVDLVLSGHSHAYERSFLIGGHYGTSDTLDPGTMILDAGDGRPDGDGAYRKEETPGAGAVYMVAGNASIAGGGSLDHPVMFVSLNQLGSLVLDFDGTRLDATFIDSLGGTPDTFTLIQDTNAIFSDGFEAGSTSTWSDTLP